ncbi:MAG: PD40 domain-containing protein, partial [Armatimonadetes bacterium]|nr:PD40 domain-containing protein [Armatimonadota bacterium]
TQSVAASAEPARRITVHPAYESAPVFSPDGSKIAFSSNRFGASDVFVMSASGGEPRRVTNFSGGSSLQGWTPDGKSLLITQSREHQRRGAAMYLAPVSGGRAKPVLTISNLMTGSVSPDGNKIAFAKGSNDWKRRGYRGAANADIWVYKTAVKQFVRVTDFDGQDLWPLMHPDGKSVVFVSERDGTYNLYRQVIGSDNAEQLTRYKGDGVRLPSLAANGSAVVYEVGDRIETLSLSGANAAPKTIELAIAADEKITDTVTETKTAGADELTASPDAAQFALAIQGDLFAVDREGGRATRLTDAISRDGDAAWAKDGKSLLFISRKDGNAEIYRVQSADPGEPLLSRSLKRMSIRVTKTPEREQNLTVSPDGKRVAYGLGDNTLLVGSADTVTDAKPVVSGKFPIGSYHWSPDSRYIVFSREDEEFNSDIYIVPADGSEAPRNISMHPRNDGEPHWSPDGNKIFWTSERLDRREDLYYVYLTEADDERTGEQWARLREKAKTSKATDGAKSAKPAPATVPAIDFDDIATRFRRLTNLPGGESF